jgi:hypothetical protein
MKSKQINFFIVPEDYKLINNFLSNHNCSIYLDSYIDKKLNPIKSLPKIEEEIFQVFLSNNRFNISLITKSNEKSSYFDIIKSDLIEFSLGGFYPYDKTILQKGRLYYISEFFEDDELKSKDLDFVEWSDEVLKDFKKKFLKKYSNHTTIFYTENAIKWIEENQALFIESKNNWKK